MAWSLPLRAGRGRAGAHVGRSVWATTHVAAARSAATTAVLGAGSFGSVVARVMAQSEATGDVRMWARRADLCEEINTRRTNQQYLGPDSYFSPKVQAFPDVADALRGASIVVVGVPSAFLPALLGDLQKHRAAMTGDVAFVSLIKSLHHDGHGRLTTTCEELAQHLDEGISGSPAAPVMALMGPNIYTEMARDEFAEATLGHLPADSAVAAQVRKAFMTDVFSTSLCDDRTGVELCGGLKNVVSLAAGFCEGLGQGANTRAAVIRAGLREMSRFAKQYGAPGVRDDTFYREAAGMGDLVLTCIAGRGRGLAAEFVRAYEREGPCCSEEESSKRWARLEEETLNGMRIPDWHNARIVKEVSASLSPAYPLFAAVYEVAYGSAPPACILQALKASIDADGSARD